LTPLPVDAVLPEITRLLAAHSSLVLIAPPGAGKTTRVPPALLPIGGRQLWVLEPRRLAARLAARRVAQEAGEQPGKSVGYRVRFEQSGNPATRLWFLTEGVLTRLLGDDPNLRDASIIILDEFHERHLDGDLALAWVRRLQRTTRSDLKLLILSATLDAAPVAAFLGGCPVLESQGRLFPMSIRYRPHSAEPLEEQVRQAVITLAGEGLDGDILVFLPGAAEIARCLRHLEPETRRHALLLTPLHGDLSSEQQDRAILPAAQRKVILSTNVAESSVTIEGVSAVIDSGLARMASYSPWTGLPELKVVRISQASATQRAGRSARLRPGRVIRLFSEEDYLRRPLHDAPEITRADLAGLALSLKKLGVPRIDGLDWLDHPPAPAVEAAEALLERLGAASGDGALTAVGHAMSRCPLPPRLARLVVEAKHRGAGEQGALAASLLSLGARLPSQARLTGASDLFALFDGDWPPNTPKLAASIRSAMRIRAGKPWDDIALRIAALAAFPDRVARRRKASEILLSGGGSARLSRASTVSNAEFLVAIDIEERMEQGLPLVRLASAIDPAWLLDLFPDRIKERVSVEWNRDAERVDAVSALLYDELPVEETRGGTPDPDLATALLAAKATDAGLERFVSISDLRTWLSRLRLASAYSGLTALTEQDALETLLALCQGRRSFSELEAAAGQGGLIRQLESRLGREGSRLLEELTPARWRLPSGRFARIEYTDDQPPRLAAKLQEFFGMRQSPAIARGQVPLVLLLLAPNQRPVQTTTDLAGFWQRLYPQVRKELMRRYPKHAWPENPG
jgi:ATP-dependent helicase HrpB